MSRSYKKNPWATDATRKSTKQKKRLANQKFRRQIAREEEMLTNPQYKKYSESWDIVDYKSRMTRQEAEEWYLYNCDNEYIKRRYPTLEAWLKYWDKCYRRK